MLQQNKFEEFTDKEFVEFCKYIYDNVGINLTEKKRNLVHNRLRKRLVLYNMTSYGEYFRFVKSPQAKDELVQVIDAITTNVTSFFRDPKQFQILSQLVLPYYEGLRKKIRIWSAACSSGEEPYTIAIEILKYAKNLDFEILASDISTKMLASGQKGVYTFDQVKTVTDHYLKDFFNKLSDNEYEVKPAVKKYVKFTQLNLIEDNFPQNLDIVFCRNVVIYFDKPTKDLLYQKFYDSMNKDGFFFVGHAESLFSNPLYKFFKPSVYRLAEGKGGR